jgi:prophage regulatory protein
MKIVSRTGLRQVYGIPYTDEHLARLENQGLFPRSLNLGPGRVGYIDTEVEAYLQARADARKLSKVTPEVRAAEIAVLRRHGLGRQSNKIDRKTLAKSRLVGNENSAGDGEREPR